MTHNEYLALCEYLPVAVSAASLSNQAPRTLLYGYDVQRNTFHVYLNEQGQLVRVLYDADGFLIDGYQAVTLNAEECVPNKRVYPGKSDFEFCRLLARMLGRDLPFTTFTEAERSQAFYGKRLEELVEVDFRELEVAVDVSDSLIEAVIEGTQPADYQAALRHASWTALKGVLVETIEPALEQTARNEKLGKPAPALDGLFRSLQWGLGDFIRKTGTAVPVAELVTLAPAVDALLQDTARAALDAHREKLAASARHA